MTKYVEVEGIDASTYAGKAAMAVKTKLRGILGDDILTVKLIDFVTYINLNNRFSSKGIFITDNNKEEAYIKIIETGDESLISDLEQFITIKDSLADLETKKNEYTGIINKLKMLTDKNNEAAVNSIIEEYLRR
jgi:hypothetical protein